MRYILSFAALTLAACGMPLWRVPPAVHRSQVMPDPPESPAAISTIHLSHSACLGRCPIYEFALSANGLARFEGICYTQLLGTYEAPLDSAVFARVARLVLESDYFRSDTVLNVMDDISFVTVEVLLTDGRHRAVYYGPGQFELPLRVEAVMSALPWRSVAPPRPSACAT